MSYLIRMTAQMLDGAGGKADSEAGRCGMSLITNAPESAMQHWHTAYVPMDGGVYAVEVFTPTLHAPIPMEGVVLVAPLRPPEPVPEPGTAWFTLIVMVAMVLYVLKMRMPLRCWWLLWKVRWRILRAKRELEREIAREGRDEV